MQSPGVCRGTTLVSAVSSRTHACGCMETVAGWWAVVGTLAGVIVTAVAGLVTAYLTHRWQRERFDVEQRIAVGRALQISRRDVYGRYLVATQQLYDTADHLYLANRGRPKNPAELRAAPPEAMRSVLAVAEAARVEVLLLAGPKVRNALGAYDDVLGQLWPAAASGSDRSLQVKSTERYDRLVEAMHDEVINIHSSSIRAASSP